MRVWNTGENRNGDRIDLANPKLRIDHKHAHRRLIDQCLVLQRSLPQCLLDLLALGDVERDARNAHAARRLTLEVHPAGDHEPAVGAVRLPHPDILM